MTSMIDTDSSNFNVSMANGYGIRNAVNQTAMLEWWHGTGAWRGVGGRGGATAAACAGARRPCALMASRRRGCV